MDKAADPPQYFLNSPNLFGACQLVENTADRKIVKAADGSPNALFGGVVSSLHRLRYNDTGSGGFFIFGDLSVRTTGTFRLLFMLFDMRLRTLPGSSIALPHCVYLGRTYTEPFRGELPYSCTNMCLLAFKVLTQKDYKGLEESTYLSRTFSDQGVRLRLRKEPRATSHTTSKKRGYPSFTEESPARPEEEDTDFQDNSNNYPAETSVPYHESSAPSAPYPASDPTPFPPGGFTFPEASSTYQPSNLPYAEPELSPGTSRPNKRARQEYHEPLMSPDYPGAVQSFSPFVSEPPPFMPMNSQYNGSGGL